MKYTPVQNYINGKLIEPQSGGYLDNINPAEGKVYSLIPDSDEKDVALAIDSAQKAFPFWRYLYRFRREKRDRHGLGWKREEIK